MKSAYQSILTISFAILFSAAVATAGVGLQYSSAVIENPGTITISPAGSRNSLAAIGSVITVTVLDINDYPAVGYPYQDIWVEGTHDASLVVCPGGSVADADTDVNGQTTISGKFYGGGQALDGVRVMVSGVATINLPLPLQIVSPDMNADRIVNIADVAIFAIEYSGPYSVLADLNPDGMNDIVDVAEFAISFGERCP